MSLTPLTATVIPFRPRLATSGDDNRSPRKEGTAIVINLPPNDPGLNRISFEEMAELMSWSAAAAHAEKDYTWIVEEQADPARGQMERIGRTPDGCDFFSLSIERPAHVQRRKNWRRHLRVWKKDGEWLTQAVWAKPPGSIRHYRSLRAALECIVYTIDRGLRPVKPGDPVDGYQRDKDGYEPGEWMPARRL